jgi:hypothetical protein
MKKPTAKIREDIARLREELRQTETRDAERIGRIALKAGIGDLEIEPNDLLVAFEELTARFRPETKSTHGRRSARSSANGAGEAAGQASEA